MLLPASRLLPLGMLFTLSAQRGLLVAGERLAEARLMSPNEVLVAAEGEASSLLTEYPGAACKGDNDGQVVQLQACAMCINV